MTVALAAAGTGGHVYPALAVADALVDSGIAADEIVFFGGSRIEASTVPQAGYDFVELEIRGLRRSLAASNLTLPVVVARARRRIADELIRRRTRVVAVFGGYVSVPAALAARSCGLPIVVHEQNAHPGLANRLIAPRAAATLVAFPAAAERLRGARLVGNPLRRELADFSRAELREKARDGYGIPESIPTLGVLGGSLGAAVLNEATVRLTADADPQRLGIVHLTGTVHFDEMQDLAARAQLPWVTRPFEPAMEMFYAASDLVLSRAGALAVSELAATGTPSVLVPLEATHQSANAAELAAASGAVIVPQQEIDRVPVEVQQLLADGARRRDMGAAAAGLATPGAAAAVAAAIREAFDD